MQTVQLVKVCVILYITILTMRTRRINRVDTLPSSSSPKSQPRQVATMTQGNCATTRTVFTPSSGALPMVFFMLVNWDLHMHLSWVFFLTIRDHWQRNWSMLSEWLYVMEKFLQYLRSHIRASSVCWQDLGESRIPNTVSLPVWSVHTCWLNLKQTTLLIGRLDTILVQGSWRDCLCSAWISLRMFLTFLRAINLCCLCLGQ